MSRNNLYIGKSSVGNMFGEFHAPYAIKISFVDYEEVYAHCS
jgi:hypothetical protein